MSEHTEKPWSTELPNEFFDTIVIGSGMGGMTCAALLTDLGDKVLLLEQHYVPGGFTHTFKRPGYEWDVGVHAVGEVTQHSMTGRLLHKLTRGRLEWKSLGPVYDEFHYPDGFRIDFPDSPQQFRQNLEDAFPNEAEAIHSYMNLVRDIAGTMRGYYLARMAPKGLAPVLDRMFARKAQKYLSQRTSDVVAGLTNDMKLRNVLTAQWGYYGSPPSRSSFAMQALVVKHFLHGGYYPVGGSGRIAEELCARIADGGGATVIRADVEQIIIEEGRAVGVRLAKSTRRDACSVRAKKIISAAGVQSTVTRLLPSGTGPKWTPSIAKLKPASAHLCLYLGFEGDIRQAGASAANKWFYQTWDNTIEVWDVDESGPADGAVAPVLYTSFPSLKNPDHVPGDRQRHTGEVVTFVPYELFQKWTHTRWKKRGEDYDALKKKLTDALLKQLLRHMPGLRPLVRFVELSTPASTEHFVRPMSGSIYGLEPTPERFQNPWLRPRSPIPGLFFAGSEISTVGVIGAMMGGVLCAVSSEPVKGVDYLRKLGR